MKLYTLEIEQYSFEYSNIGYEFFLSKNEAISRKSEIENNNYKGVIVYINEMDFEDAKDIMTVNQLEKLCQNNLSPLLEKSIEDNKFRLTEDDVKKMIKWYENSLKESPIQ